VAFHPGKWNGFMERLTYKRTIGYFCRWRCFLRHHHCTLKMRVNDFRPCIMEIQGAVGLHWCIIELSATVLGKIASDKIVTMSHNDSQRSFNGASMELQWSFNGASMECQLSVNNFWSCILQNLTAIEHRYLTINQSPTLIGKIASDNIESAFYNGAPMERQQFL